MATESTTPSDTTTTLNSGTGGDVMDESTVTQASGTTAKRTRVVIAGDSVGKAVCDVVNTDPKEDVYALPVRDPKTVEVAFLLNQLLLEQQKTNQWLELLVQSANSKG